MLFFETSPKRASILQPPRRHSARRRNSPRRGGAQRGATSGRFATAVPHHRPRCTKSVPCRRPPKGLVWIRWKLSSLKLIRKTWIIGSYQIVICLFVFYVFLNVLSHFVCGSFCFTDFRAGELRDSLHRKTLAHAPITVPKLATAGTNRWRKVCWNTPGRCCQWDAERIATECCSAFFLGWSVDLLTLWWKFGIKLYGVWIGTTTSKSEQYAGCFLSTFHNFSFWLRWEKAFMIRELSAPYSAHYSAHYLVVRLYLGAMQVIEGRGYDRIRILSFLKKQSLCILLYSINSTVTVRQSLL